MSSSTKVASKRSSRVVKELPLPEEKLRELYRQMLLIRRFEEKTGQQYQLKKFSGFCHLYIGQEAVAVGTIAALQVPKDYTFTTYRDHAHALLLGVSAREVMAELFMKRTGCSKGKGGSMHMYNGKTRYMGGNGIIGGHIPLAIGAAFASKYRNEGAIAVCYMGDATVNQGTFHESLNMAGAWKLPAVFIVENNFYGMGTAISRTSAQPDLYKRTAEAYNIPGIRVNGMDVLEVYEAMKDAAESARAGQPVFLEMVTYRYRGHSMSDPATTYRNKEEVQEWQQKDPMTNLAAQFPDIITPEWIAEQDAEIKVEVEDAVKFAEESEYPDQLDVWTHVYADYPGYPGPEVNPNKFAFPYNEYP
ncbi:MAG TPA: pyruvate dehydrogenase (acetyl-transferring) E1 component subunit alpha [Candidatus Sumerlaeota bacterium]|nr:pyruvate dehydrogenase (acetyl-transferring) E1 component subunit alpha [Candidatus Sumerlaeota bacterium]